MRIILKYIENQIENNSFTFISDNIIIVPIPLGTVQTYPVLLKEQFKLRQIRDVIAVNQGLACNNLLHMLPY